LELDVDDWVDVEPMLEVEPVPVDDVEELDDSGLELRVVAIPIPAARITTTITITTILPIPCRFRGKVVFKLTRNQDALDSLSTLALVVALREKVMCRRKRMDTPILMGFQV